MVKVIMNAKNRSLSRRESQQDLLLQLSKNVAEIARSLKFKGAPRLWTIADIAEWLDLSEITVKARVIKRQGFPAPVAPTGHADKARKRWFADEVIRWARHDRGENSGHPVGVHDRNSNAA